MLRRWILAAAACAFCLPPNAQAQNGVMALADRLFPVRTENEPRPVVHDQEVQPAAVANNMASRRPRPQSSSQRQGQQRSSNGLFGGLQNFLSRPSRSNGDGTQPPMPYDESEVRAYRQSSQAVGGAPSVQTPRATARTAPGASRPAAATARNAPVARTTPQPRVARTSPRTDGRHNELAEALSGLRDEEADPQPQATRKPAAAPAKAPIDAEPETPPSYVRDEAIEKPINTTAPVAKSKPPARQASAPKAPPAARTPVDVRDALLNDDSLRQEIATRVADSAGDAETLGQLNSPAAARKTASQRMSKAAATPSADNTGLSGQSLDPPSTQEVKSLGQIPEAAARAFQPPAAPAASDASTSFTQSPASAGAGQTGQPQKRGVLLSCRQPAIVSKVEGPNRVIVGRQAAYRVVLENRGDDSARDLTASIAIPAGAEVVDASASNGVVNRTAPSAAGEASSITWQLYELPPGAAQSLTLQIIARTGRPMQLGVQWNHAPVTGQATVEVQEPKLHMDISGPAEVTFGKAQRFALMLANPGTGAAEQVRIELTPPGGDQRATIRHNVGALAPGESKRIELELTARQGGDLKIQAVALASGDLRTETIKTVLCRKAELQVDWRGPDKNFAGAVATYYFRVRNPGTAAASGVSVNVNLPPGAEFIDASDGHAWNSDQRTVSWMAGEVNPQEDRFLQLRCRLSQPGVNKIDLAARTAAGDLSDAKSLPIAIEALADLKLEVIDPKGVVPVGETAAYEIHVRNRGLTAARGVNVIAMFSEGIDPAQVEGGQHTIADGRVTFRTIDSLPGGAEAVFRIHAQALQPGTHVFRAEVVCDDLETKLSAEETTRFFVEEQRWADASSAYGSDGGAATR